MKHIAGQWIPMEKESPKEGQRVLIYKGKIKESGERDFVIFTNGRYCKTERFMNKKHGLEVVETSLSTRRIFLSIGIIIFTHHPLG